MEKKKGYLKPDGTYPLQRMKRVKGDDGKTTLVVDEAWEAKFAKAIKEYPEILRSIREIEDKIYSANKPEQHHYSLQKK